MPINLTFDNRRVILENPLLAWKVVQDAYKSAQRKPGQELISEELIRERREEAEREKL